MISRKELATYESIGAEPEPTFLQLRETPDEGLIELIKRGNHDAFASLFDRYYRLVLSITLKILRDQAEAEDLMQDIFFDLYKDAHLFDPSKGRLKYWLFSRVYRRSYNRLEYLRLRGYFNPTEPEEIEQIAAVDSGDIWGEMTREECRRVIQQGFATLNAQQRIVVEMACFQGKSMSEIAAETGESVVNVRNHYYRGLKKLKGLMQGKTAVRRETSLLSPREVKC